MALMGRVVGVGAAGEPGGDIVMAAIVVWILFSVYRSVQNSNHLRGPKPVGGQRKGGDAQ